jgi:hypothetical protein
MRKRSDEPVIVRRHETFSLIYALGNCELDRLDGVIEAQQRIPNGYTWSGIIDVVLREAKLDTRQLHYDPEAGMVAIRGADESTLRNCAAVIDESLQHPERIAQIARDLAPD